MLCCGLSILCHPVCDNAFGVVLQLRPAGLCAQQGFVMLVGSFVNNPVSTFHFPSPDFQVRVTHPLRVAAAIVTVQVVLASPLLVV